MFRFETDMSLDEIIERKRSSTHGDGKREGGSRGGGSGIRSNGAHGGGGGGPMRRDRRKGRQGSNGLGRHSEGDSNSSRARVAYEAAPKRPQNGGGLTTTAADIYLIVISNLYFRVTSTDMRDLFEEFGPVITATVHRDARGRSLGTASVTFGDKNAALNAVRKYHNAILDGCSMKIELSMDVFFSTAADPAPPPREVAGGNAKKRGNDRRRSRGRRGGRDGNNADKKKTLNKNELDAQLDVYFKNNKSDAFIYL